MPESLKGKRLRFLATDGFEQVEPTEPKRAFEEAGATTEVVSPKKGKSRGGSHTSQIRLVWGIFLVHLFA